MLFSKPLAFLSHTNWPKLVLPGQRAQGKTGHGVRGNFLKTDQVPSQKPRPGNPIPLPQDWCQGRECPALASGLLVTAPLPWNLPCLVKWEQKHQGSIHVDSRVNWLQLALGTVNLPCRFLPKGHRAKDPRQQVRLA